MTEVLHISTVSRRQLVDLTDQVKTVIRRAKVQEELCALFSTRTTAALTTGEIGEGDGAGLSSAGGTGDPAHSLPARPRSFASLIHSSHVLGARLACISIASYRDDRGRLLRTLCRL